MRYRSCVALFLLSVWGRLTSQQDNGDADIVFQGACDNGGSRGWLDSIGSGYHPGGIFGPSGLHGQTFGIPSNEVTIHVFPQEEDGEIPASLCCPERYYPLREYRVRITCPTICAVLISVEYDDIPPGGVESTANQVGQWRLQDESGRLRRYTGSVREYNSLRSPTITEESLASSYTAYWTAPAFEAVSTRSMAIRVTAVLDEDDKCPGTYAEYVMPSLIVCGDGFMDAKEECEDGNAEDGDGCSSTCTIEPGWTCDGRVPSPVSMHNGNLISLCTKAAVIMEPSEFDVIEGNFVDVTFSLSTYVQDTLVVQFQLPADEIVIQGNSVLTFEPDNWDVPQVITFRCVENFLTESNRTYEIPLLFTASDGIYEHIEPHHLTINVIDDDVAGVVISRKSMTVTELGAQEIYTVSLSSEPRGFLKLVMEYEPSDFTLLVSPSIIAFGKENWNQPFDVIVQAPDNPDAEGSRELNVMHLVEDALLDPDYATLPRDNAVLAVTVLDNDLSSMQVVPQRLTVTEGTSSSYTVSLSSRPANLAVVKVYTTVSCNVPIQSLMTPLPTSPSPTAPIVTDPPSTDAPTLSPTPTTTSTISVDPTATPAATSTGDPATMPTSTSTARPDRPTPTPSSSLDASVMPTPTPNEASVATPVATTANAGPVTSTATPTPAASTSAPENAGSVTATPAANEVSPIMPTEISTPTPTPTPTPSDVGAVRRDVDLLSTATPLPTLPTQAPTSAPTQAPDSSCLDLTSQQPESGDAMVILGASNFIEGEELTITVPDNTFADGARSANITHFITSEDPQYNVLPELSIHAPWTVQVEIVDDDAANVIYPTSVIVTEGDEMTQFTIRLSSTPYGDVTVKLIPDDPESHLNLKEPTFSWTPLTWDMAYTVSVTTATDDQEFLGSYNVQIIPEVTSADPAYNSLQLPLIEVQVQDNDQPGVTIDMTAFPKGIIELQEGDSAAMLPVYLNSRPRGDTNVTVSFVSGNQVRIEPKEIVFVSSDFSTPKIVSVIPVDDAQQEMSPHYDIVSAVVTSGDSFYQGIKMPRIDVTIMDNDAGDGVKVVDQWGAVICPTTPCGSITLTIPPGAVPHGLELDVRVTEYEPMVPLGTPIKVLNSEGLRVSGTFSLAPHGTILGMTGVLAMAYDTLASSKALEVQPSWSLAFYRKDSPMDGDWERLEDSSFPISDGMGSIDISGFSLYYIGAGPPIAKPPTPAPTPEPVEECPPLTATRNIRLITIILGVLFGLETAGIIGYVIYFCFFKPIPEEDDGYESEESDLQIDEYLALPEGGLDSDIDNIKALPPPPPESRPVALTGPYSGANPVTDMHVVHNPEHFEPQGLMLQNQAKETAEDDNVSQAPSAGQKSPGTSAPASPSKSSSPRGQASPSLSATADNVSEPAIPPTDDAR